MAQTPVSEISSMREREREKIARKFDIRQEVEI